MCVCVCVVSSQHKCLLPSIFPVQIMNLDGNNLMLGNCGKSAGLKFSFAHNAPTDVKSQIKHVYVAFLLIRKKALFCSKYCRCFSRRIIC